MPKKRLKRFLTLFCTLFCVSLLCVAVVAPVSAANTLGGQIYKDLQANYKPLYKEGGGALEFNQVVNTDGSIKPSFADLKASEKERLLTDMINKSNKLVKNKTYTDDDQENWLEDIQNTDGIGSQLMTAILSNTKPDYVKANKIYKPFSGIIGTILGLGAILIVALLGVSMTLDIAYMSIPAFRLALGDPDGKGAEKPKFISHEAINAINVAESQGGGSSQQGGSGNKQTLVIYLRARIIMLIALGICLLYLVSGQIYNLVSWILDLVSGFI